MKKKIPMTTYISKLKFSKMELSTRDNGPRIQKLDKGEELKFGLMDLCMRAIGLTVKLTAEDA